MGTECTFRDLIGTGGVPINELMSVRRPLISAVWGSACLFIGMTSRFGWGKEPFLLVLFVIPPAIYHQWEIGKRWGAKRELLLFGLMALVLIPWAWRTSWVHEQGLFHILLGIYFLQGVYQVYRWVTVSSDGRKENLISDEDV